jgi:hypothetical protein
MKISAQIDKSTSAMFKQNYSEIVNDAREKIAKGFESNFPTLRKE